MQMSSRANDATTKVATPRAVRYEILQLDDVGRKKLAAVLDQATEVLSSRVKADGDVTRVGVELPGGGMCPLVDQTVKALGGAVKCCSTAGEFPAH
jgi:hypothetical protein